MWTVRKWIRISRFYCFVLSINHSKLKVFVQFNHHGFIEMMIFFPIFFYFFSRHIFPFILKKFFQNVAVSLVGLLQPRPGSRNGGNWRGSIPITYPMLQGREAEQLPVWSGGPPLRPGGLRAGPVSEGPVRRRRGAAAGNRTRQQAQGRGGSRVRNCVVQQERWVFETVSVPDP